MNIATNMRHIHRKISYEFHINTLSVPNENKFQTKKVNVLYTMLYISTFKLCITFSIAQSWFKRSYRWHTWLKLELKGNWKLFRCNSYLDSRNAPMFSNQNNTSDIHKSERCLLFYQPFWQRVVLDKASHCTSCQCCLSYRILRL